MNFWNATYSGVTWWQLATPWIAIVIFAALGIWGWVMAIDQKNRADMWEECEHRTRIRFEEKAFSMRIERDKERVKVKALQEKLSRLTVRPRDKSGRFQKGKA